jgi:hypothetical protein
MCPLLFLSSLSSPSLSFSPCHPHAHRLYRLPSLFTSLSCSTLSFFHSPFRLSLSLPPLSPSLLIIAPSPAMLSNVSRRALRVAPALTVRTITTAGPSQKIRRFYKKVGMATLLNFSCPSTFLSTSLYLSFLCTTVSPRGILESDVTWRLHLWRNGVPLRL